MREFLEVLNLMALPVALVGYIVVLERRLTRIQTQVEIMYEKLTGQRQDASGRDTGRALWK